LKAQIIKFEEDKAQRSHKVRKIGNGATRNFSKTRGTRNRHVTLTQESDLKGGQAYRR